tara:strand:- start:107 stop:688 length:582 start_codon:yes stop_codon:yes gene_type:complete
MKQTIYYILILLLSNYWCHAQETVDAEAVSLIGGDQNFTTMSVDVLVLALLDVEPDPGATLDIGSAVPPGSLEAGLAPGGGAGTTVNDDLWLNYSYRGATATPARIMVSSNQPVPSGFTIKILITNSGAGGDFTPNPLAEITLSDTEQPITGTFGNGYTADGLLNGYQLQYTVENPSGLSLPAGFEVTYRLDY